MSATTVPTTVSGTDVQPGSRARRRAGWAGFGLGAGLAGVVSIGGSTMVDAVYDPELAGDAAGIVARLGEQTVPILVFHTATMVCVLLLAVFAVGLRRHLAERLPADSLLPGAAFTGLLLVSVAGLMGSGLTTEFVFGVADPDLMVPEAAVFFGHWVGTIPWLWGGAGITALAVGVAGRRGAVPPWLGRVSLVMGTLLTVLAISPLQYMAGMVGPVWLVVASVGLLGADRS